MCKTLRVAQSLTNTQSSVFFSCQRQVHGKLEKLFCDTACVSFCSLACHFAYCRVILFTGVSRVSCSLFFRTRHTSLFYRARSFVFSVRSKQRKNFHSACLLTYCLNAGVSFQSLPFVPRVILACPCIHLFTQSPLEGHRWSCGGKLEFL